MITTNEIRIGNWLQDIEHFKGEFQVEAISKYVVTSPDWSLELNEIEPIELTEEWLLKFGFTKLYHFSNIELSLEFGDITFEYSYTYHVNGINKMLTLRIWIEDVSSEDIPQLSGIYIENGKYVHQLQNLYFAITGEELTIK